MAFYEHKNRYIKFQEDIGTCKDILTKTEFEKQKNNSIKKEGSSIIPFASGSPINLKLNSKNSSFLGFGHSISNVLMVDNIINITNLSGTPTNFAFSVPCPIEIKSISAFFSTTNTLSLIDTKVKIKAAIYKSNNNDNNFTAIDNAYVILEPELTSVVIMGNIIKGIKNDINIHIDAGTRLILAFTVETFGEPKSDVITGYASAGIEIL